MLRIVSQYSQSQLSCAWASDPVIYKFVIELSVYVVSGLAIYQSNLNGLKELNFQMIRSSLENDAETGVSLYLKSPFLHGYIELFLVRLEAICVARETNLSLRLSKSRELLWKLDTIEAGVQSHYGAEVSPEVSNMYVIKWQFFICVLRIFLCKVTDNQICSGTVSVQKLVDRSVHLLNMNNLRLEHWANMWPGPYESRQLGHDRNQAIYWHLSVMMSAFYRIDLLDDFSQAFQNLLPLLPPRFGQNTLKLIEIIRARKIKSQEYCLAASGTHCEFQHDGMDFFLHPDGVFGIIGDV